MPPLAVQVPFSQQPPPLQRFFAQQGWPARPQLWQAPPEQVSEVAEHFACGAGQQGWPGPPQVLQSPWLQARPVAEQRSPGQQGWFAPPQVLQSPEVQRVPAWHCPARLKPRQQGWSAPPQASHFPFAQANPSEQRVPQQGWPAPPQASQLLALLQTLLGPQTAPTATQLFCERPLQHPVVHRSPGQQGIPVPPQPAQFFVGRQRSPLLQLLPTAMQDAVVGSQQPLAQVLPAQQG